MGFQILNSNKEPVPINDLDMDVASFWGVEIHPKQYASPRGGNNWFDEIGYSIHSQGHYTTGWNNIKATLWSVQSEGLYSLIYENEEFTRKIEAIRVYLRPYFDLIDYWEGKGYTPLKVNN